MTTKHPRLRLWQEHLADYVADRTARRFAWGSNDCAQFVAGAVHAQTGVDPLDGLVQPYTTELGAAKQVTKAGGLEKLVTQVLGEPVGPLMGAVGDVGLTKDGALVLCNGQLWIGVTQEGLVMIPTDEVTKCWRVG